MGAALKPSILARFLALALVVLPLQVAAQTPSAPWRTAPATSDQLAAITERGRALEAYDQAAWHGTDAARAIAGDDTRGLTAYIAQRTPNGWTVDFGALDSTGKAFVTVLEAQSADGVHFTAQRLTTPRSDTGFLPAAAHAIQTAEATFTPVHGHRYNVAVLPRGDGTMYVYLYPGQSDSKVFPFGGDERFTISADGMQILDAHRMHNAILEERIEPNAPGGPHLVAGFHSDVVEDIPQDTDVFLVLARKPQVPEYVNARGQRYYIRTDGSIEYKGPLGAIPG